MLAHIIGLTGSIATGKSTVATMLKELDICVIDADVISRQVVEPGEHAYNSVVATFGKEILNEDNTINRKLLGKIVFSDESKRKRLNSIVHPAVREKMIEERDLFIAQGEQAIVLDIPLLFESNLSYLVDKTIVVYVDEETQLKRLMDRDNSIKEEAESRINSQMSINEKIKMADAVIDNGGTLEETKLQLITVLERWDIL